MSSETSAVIVAGTLLILARDMTRRSPAIARKILTLAEEHDCHPADAPDSVTDYRLLVAAGRTLGVCVTAKDESLPGRPLRAYWYGSEEFVREIAKRATPRKRAGPGFLEVCFREGKPVAGYYYFPGRDPILNSVARTVAGPGEGGLLADLDGKGRLIGVEVTDPGSFSVEEFNDLLREYREGPVRGQELFPLFGT